MLEGLISRCTIPCAGLHQGVGNVDSESTSLEWAGPSGNPVSLQHSFQTHRNKGRCLPADLIDRADMPDGSGRTPRVLPAEPAIERLAIGRQSFGQNLSATNRPSSDLAPCKRHPYPHRPSRECGMGTFGQSEKQRPLRRLKHGRVCPFQSQKL
jgi:hypothetical protein